MDVSSVNLSLGNLAAAQMMTQATTQTAAATSDAPASSSSGSGAAGVAVDVLAMELRAQRSLVDLFA